ncbi:MAG: DUF1499 domain-containing protein [Gammaproteobacteria bacterium]|jgi:uncharacterized protein (DUF1499 family)
MEKTEFNKHILLYWLSLSAMVIGMSVGIIAILAPVGYQINLWEYRTGFTILRTMVPFTIYIAGICIALAIALGILGKKWNSQNTNVLVGLAMVGAIVAGLTWIVPQSYLEPDGDPYPSIHDISTDTVNPPRFVAVMPLRVDADNGVEYGVSRDMNPELLIKLTQQAYPDIQPVILDVSPDTAFNRVMTAVEKMGWEVVNTSKTFGRIEATDTTFWFKFKDDIVIRLRPEDAGIRIDARSVSRVGKGDVGINAKRLRRFFEIL